MGRKISVIFLIVVLVISFASITAYSDNSNNTASQPSENTSPGYTADVPKGTPIIDGETDPIWSYAITVKLEHITIDSPNKDENHAVAQAKLLWDEQNIYCLVEVKDKSVCELGYEWRQDSVEYFVDAKNLKGFAYEGKNNGQYRLGITGIVSGSGEYDVDSFTKNSKVKRTSDGYIQEVAIPLTSHEVTGKEGMKVGFDLQLNDDSNNDGNRDYIISWNQDGKGFENPSQLGTITLVPAMEGAPSPEPKVTAAPEVTASPTSEPVPVKTVSLNGKSVEINTATYVPTFECLSLYWNPGLSGQDKMSCSVEYRKKGFFNKWNKAMDLLYDSRTDQGRLPEFRGSIVGLKSGTEYEVRLKLSNGISVKMGASTMSEAFPIGETVYLPKTSDKTLVIDKGGTPEAYKLYTFDPANGSAAIDLNKSANICISVSVPYVIIRGLTLKGAAVHGIDLIHGSHHIVIEDCEISGWGSCRDDVNGWGIDLNSGIHAVFHDKTVKDIVIQRNKIHDPTYTANPWDYGHPAGPNGISFDQDGGGHNIIRYNEVTGDDTHFFMDCIGGAENYSLNGFPGPDSDVYSNLVSNAYDDAIEIEGGGMNVRVWGNYMDKTGTGISSAVCSLGPLYIYRNVMNTSRMRYTLALDNDVRGGFGKAGDDEKIPTFGGGRRYYFNNTALQAPPPEGSKSTLGAGAGIYDAGGPLTNTVSRNNIWHIWNKYWDCIQDLKTSKTNNFDYDLYNARLTAYEGAEAHGIHGIPVYAPGNGWESGSGGQYALDPKSPGYHAAEVIPNFNDMYGAPDMGAHQSGTPAMQFGVKAAAINAGSGGEIDVKLVLITAAGFLIVILGTILIFVKLFRKSRKC